MAEINEAVLYVQEGFFYTADVDTEFPTDLANPGAAYTTAGNTSIEDLFGMDSEGGEETILGTLQNKRLKQVRQAIIDSFNFNLAQWDEASLKLYFGSNSAALSTDAEPPVATKWIGVPKNPVATERCFLATFTDGVNWLGFWVPRASLFRGDAFSIDNTESFSLLPIKVTPLDSAEYDVPYAVHSLGA